MNVLGIDIGGSGIKGAPVDTKTGELMAERHRIPTPQPATPKAIAEVVAKLVDHFEWTGPVGITFPGVVVDGEIRTAANVDKSWIGVNANKLFGKNLDSVMVINDADAAGMAEMAFGAGKNNQGVVLVLTIGTGIGSALFVGGKLVPNTEFGHLELKGKEAESRASDAARDKRDMSWDKYAKRIGQYLRHMEMLFSPGLMVLGGGISKKSDKYLPMVDLRTPVVPAMLLNEAGIVGAALAAEETMALKPARGTSRRTTSRRTTTTTSRPRGARATTGATRSAARRSAATTPNRGTSSRSGTTTARRTASSGTSKSTSGRSTARTGTGRTATSRSTTARATGTSRSTTGRSTTGRSTTGRSTTGRSTTGRSTTGTGRSTTARKTTPSRSTTGTSRSTTARKTTPSRSTTSRSTATSKTSASRSNGSATPSRSTSSRSTRTSPARATGSGKTSTSRSNGTPAARRTTRSAGGTTRRSATPKRSSGSSGSSGSRRMTG
ncbi:polyphosphate--glucose phosphotransferase [Herbidospora galbida]|uniref:polyphosphate--glucose phosphotransferase n=1 Tax=Herbidospora galbida TaxID=2575442 RepID=UPI001BB0AA09